MHIPFLLLAFALSFSVYLIPLFQIEAGWYPVGSVLWGQADQSALTLAWVAALLFLQFLAFLVFGWLLSNFRWTKLVPVIFAAPVFVVVANAGLLYAIPLLVLVAPESSPELGELKRVCRIPDAAVAQVNSGADLGLVRASETWLVVGPDRAMVRLTMPECRLAAVEGLAMGPTIDSVAPGGHYLGRGEDGAIRYFGPFADHPINLAPPRGMPYWTPILSDDGVAILWLDRLPSQGAGAQRLQIRDIVGGNERSVLLSDLPESGQFTLIGARARTGPFTLAKFRNTVFSVGLDGRILSGPVVPEGIYDARWGFQWLGDGWIAWDGYRDEGRSRILWSQPTGKGEIVIPRGRDIDAAGIAADGQIIGYAASSTLRIGGTRGMIVLVRTKDGSEIYRRYQPKHVRSTLAFLGSRHLAVTRFEDGREMVEVYLLPTPDH